MAADSPPLLPSDLRVGDRVEFVRNASGQYAADDPLYEPTVPAGTTAIVVKVATDYVRVRPEDSAVASEPLRLWRDGLFDDPASNVLSSVRKL